MGTTAEKGAYLNETKSQLKTAINNLGGNITSETTFREYAEELQDVYDNYPKTEYQEGTEINLGVTSKGKLDFSKIYQEVEYIECSGTQFLMTNTYIDNNNISIKTKITTPNMPSAEQDIVGNQDNTTGRFILGLSANKAFLYSKYSNTADINAWSGEYSGEQTLEIEAIFNQSTSTKTLKVNGTSYSETYIKSISNSNNAVQVFSNGNGENRFVGKIYYVKLYKGDTLSLDLCPCYRKNDNVIGMYDKINNKFYTNAGTGTFTKGADVGSGFDEIAGYGQTSQESTNGYNIYYIDKNNYSQAWGTLNVTLTRTGYKISGTGEGSTGFTITSRKITLPAGTYTFVLKHTSALRVAISNTSYAVLGIVEIGSTYASFSINQETDITLTLIPANGASYNEENEIMLYSGNYDSSKVFEQYTGGYSSPSPNWEQKIQHVRGKNLFNKSLLEQGGMSASTESGRYGKDFESTIRVRTNYVEVLPNTIYSISINDTGKVIAYFFEYNSNKIASETVPYVTVNSNTHTFTTASTTHYIRVAFGNSDSSNIVPSDVTEAQIEQNSQATPYLPYNTLEITRRGKNLFDKNNITFYASNNTDFNGVDASNKIRERTNSIAIASVGIKTNTIYKISGLPSGWELLGIGTFTQENGSNTSQGSINNNTFIINNDNVKYIFYLFSNNSSTEVATELFNSANIQIEQGSSATTYEPYITPITKTLALGDIELNKIGTYQDYIYKSSGKWYIHKNVGKYTITGQEQISLNQNKAYVFQFTISNVISGVGDSMAYSKCNLFYFKYGNPTDETNENYFWVYNLVTPVIVIQKTIVTDLESFKTWLSNNKPVLYYRLATPTDTEITDTTLISQLEEIYQLMSIKGTTIIETSGNLPIIVKARALKGE